MRSQLIGQCTGGSPCSRCSRLEIQCTYLKVPRKKGPRPKSASQTFCSTSVSSVLELMDDEISGRQSGITELEFQDAIPLFEDGVKTDQSSLGSSISISSPRHAESGFLLVLQPILLDAVDSYIVNFYPLMPIVNINTLRQRVEAREQLWNRQFGALILAITAYVAIGKDADVGEALEWTEKALTLHASASVHQDVTLDTVVTVMTLGAVFRSTDRSTAAFLKVREAMALADVLKINEPQALQHYSPTDRELALVIFWKLSVAVR